MPEIKIRDVRGEEMEKILHLQLGYAFGPTPPLSNFEEWADGWRSMRDEATNYVLFEDAKARATVSYSPMSQNIRGSLYPLTAGVWGVTAHPEGRRKGYARQVITHAFERMYEAEMPITTLYAFRESFYVRLGYVSFPQAHVASFSPQPLHPLLRQELGGHVELTHIAEGFEEYRDYLRKRQGHIHGMGLFSNQSTDHMRKKNDFWLARAYIDGELCGLMIYKIQNYEGTMTVPHFYYDHSQGRYLLLEWFGRHIDQVSKVEVTLPPTEFPETWFPDLKLQLSSKDAPLARVIDVRKVGGMRVGTGGFSAHISDPQCPWNEGNYRFTSADGVLEVSSSQEADCDLSIQGLSALIFGVHDPDTFAIRGWGNPSPRVQAAMRQLFPACVPYLHERF